MPSASAKQEMTDTQPLERKPTVSFEKLLEAVAFGNRDPDVLSSLASRLARLDQQLTDDDRKMIQKVTGGKPLAAITRGIVEALDPDVHVEAARSANGGAEPSDEQIEQAAKKLLAEAAKPIAANPDAAQAAGNSQEVLRADHRHHQQGRSDRCGLLRGGKAEGAKRGADLREVHRRQQGRNHRAAGALQRPYKQRLTFKQIQELAQALELPHDGIRGLTPDVLWHAYETLDRSKVRGSGGRVLTDIVSLVRFAIHQQPELHPYQEDVNARFERWMAQQESANRRVYPGAAAMAGGDPRPHRHQRRVEMDDLELSPFSQKGGLGKAYQVFGNELEPLVNELNEVLAA